MICCPAQWESKAIRIYALFLTCIYVKVGGWEACTTSAPPTYTTLAIANLQLLRSNANVHVPKTYPHNNCTGCYCKDTSKVPRRRLISAPHQSASTLPSWMEVGARRGHDVASECAITESQSFRFHFEVDSEIRHASGDSYDSRSNINEWR